MLTLLNETADLALDLLERNGCLAPFCKARTLQGDSIIISADGDGVEEDPNDYFRRCEDSVRKELRQRVSARQISEFAFCCDKEIKIQGEMSHRRFLKIDFQNGSRESAVYLFPLTLQDGKAQLAANFLQAESPEKLL